LAQQDPWYGALPLRPGLAHRWQLVLRHLSVRRCPSESQPLRHIIWWAAISELVGGSATVLMVGVAKMLVALGVSGFRTGPKSDAWPGVALALAKMLLRLEQAASEVEVASGCWFRIGGGLVWIAVQG
jgi:hypothetical protein